MRIVIILGLALAACAEPTPAERAAVCIDAWQDYDRDVERARRQQFGGIGVGITFGGVPASELDVVRLRQYDCPIYLDDYPEPTVDPATFARAPALTPGRRGGYVHVATLATGGVDRLTGELQALGWPTQTLGAPGLGRRVFIGPLGSATDQAAGVRAARSLGFPAAYGLSRLP